MPDIRYVCLSDTHFGEQGSLLTHLEEGSYATDPSKPSRTLKQLVECIQHLVSRNESRDKPRLILNGDILELALSTDSQAAMAFERFVELVLREGDEIVDRRLIYVPGNHDHHLWESARETQYVDYICREEQLGPGALLPEPWHKTRLFVEEAGPPVSTYFLTNLVRRYRHLAEGPEGQKAMVSTAYPNLALRSDDRRRCVLFHHGHFAEPIYELMSQLKTLLFPERRMPDAIDDIEAENFAWIDFFWSVMGRSGEAGSDMAIVYKRLQDQREVDRMVDTLASSLARRFDLPGAGDAMETFLARRLLHYVIDRATARERSLVDSTSRDPSARELPLSEPARDGLRSYVSGPLRRQLRDETGGDVPPDVALVFGHTHKPFQMDMPFDGYPEWVDVYNTGGWVVDTLAPAPRHGAAVVLLDEDLQAVSLRIYNEAADRGGYGVRIEEPLHPGEEHSPFFRRMEGLIDPHAEPWKTLSDIVCDEVRSRRETMRATIDRFG